MFVTRPAAMDRRWRCSEGSEVAPSCPRCASPNTKFCYYNNYSRSQPRYLCKSCRRYWTKGGSLRNVPVGGGCRKSRRTRSDPPPPSRISPAPLASDSRSGSSAGPPPGVQAGGVINGQSPEIDLALVFSKFFNDNPVYDPELPGFDNPLTGPAGIESLNPSWQRDGLLEELPGVLVGEKTEFGDGRAHEVTRHDHPNTFGLPDALGDEAAAAHHDHDIFWSISGGRGYGNGNFTSNSTWEDEYDLFPSDDPLTVSTHLMCDNWSAFDLSGF